MTGGLRIFTRLSVKQACCRWLAVVARCVVVGSCLIAGNAISPADAQIVVRDRAESDRLDGIRAPSSDLTVVSWNFLDGVAAGAVVCEKQVQRVWRHTFVPRSRVERRASKLSGKIRDADVVLLQGIRSVREVRTLFPARDWKVIVSRQILKAGRGRGYLRRKLPAGFGTTAVAVRYQLGLRVTGQEHLLELVGAGPEEVARDGGDITVASDPLRELRGEAGLAVRVSHEGRVIWFVSAAFAGRCLRDRACEARASLAKWIEDKRDFDFPVVTGGRFRPAEELAEEARLRPDGSAAQAKACRGQDIELDSKLKGEVKLVSDAGCFAVVVVEP